MIFRCLDNKVLFKMLETVGKGGGDISRKDDQEKDHK